MVRTPRHLSCIVGHRNGYFDICQRQSLIFPYGTKPLARARIDYPETPLFVHTIGRPPMDWINYIEPLGTAFLAGSPPPDVIEYPLIGGLILRPLL